MLPTEGSNRKILDRCRLVNTRETKQMLIDTAILADPLLLVTLGDAPIDRVVTFKLLLGVNVASDLKWNTHIEAISRKAVSRLYF